MEKRDTGSLDGEKGIWPRIITKRLRLHRLISGIGIEVIKN